MTRDQCGWLDLHCQGLAPFTTVPACPGAYPNAGGEPRPRAVARHERRLLGVGSSAWFGVQGKNRVQRAALLPSGCFSLYASYFPVE